MSVLANVTDDLRGHPCHPQPSSRIFTTADMHLFDFSAPNLFTSNTPPYFYDSTVLPMGRALLTHDDFSTLPFFQAFTTLLHPPYIPYGSSALFSLPVSISFLDIPYFLLAFFFCCALGRVWVYVR